MSAIFTASLVTDSELPLDESLRFQAWLNSFDERHADMSVRLDTLLSSLGVTFEGATPEVSQH